MTTGLSVICFLLGIILLIWFGGPWFNTAWYAVQYKVGLNQVHIDPMPKDCDWGHAPLGDKGCHFAPDVMTYNASGKMVGAKSPIISWQELEAYDPKVATVVIHWKQETD